jgi:hypothetical protein
MEEGGRGFFFFGVLSQHLPGGTEKNHKNTCQDSQSPGSDLNPKPPKYEALAMLCGFLCIY